MITRIAFVSLFLMSAAVLNAQAAHVQAGATICISQKYLEKYEALLVSDEQEFLKEMRDRVQCVEKKKDAKAVKVSEVGQHVQVELIEGFKVWTNVSNFVE